MITKNHRLKMADRTAKTTDENRLKTTTTTPPTTKPTTTTTTTTTPPPPTTTKLFKLGQSKLRKEVIKAKNIANVFRRSQRSTQNFSIFAVIFATT